MTTWSGRCSSRGYALLGVGFALVVAAIGLATVIVAAGSGAAAWAGWTVVLVGLAVGVVARLTSSLEVRLGEGNFTVAFGPFGRPRRVVALADVVDASAILVEPLEWGGWGYRWIPWANASAAVVRRGPGIVLALRDGSRFAVTVDDAVDGARATSAALGRIQSA
ncbi:MAG: hypothetical protein M0Z98_04135 [Actinomycetales bacterium]|nr:hypothetical protein [Actinomycetales bacterium]